MITFLESLLELATFVTCIYLIVSGYSDKEKYNSTKYIRKRNLIFGIILLIILLIAGFPDMYNGFIRGYNGYK